MEYLSTESWQEQYRNVVRLFTGQVNSKKNIKLDILFNNGAYQVILNNHPELKYLSPEYEYENTINCFIEFLNDETKMNHIKFISNKENPKLGVIDINGQIDSQKYQIYIRAGIKIIQGFFDLHETLQVSKPITQRILKYPNK